jgi:diaminobutyrate-2-oxoglutarate transaminase
MTLLDHRGGFARPCVVGDVPGPRSVEFLDRQARRESRARVYPRHIPTAVEEASGSFVRDVDGNVFIDFLAGAGVLSLGHNHPDLVRAVIDQLSPFSHGLPTPAKDAFAEARLSMLPAACGTGPGCISVGLLELTRSMRRSTCARRLPAVVTSSRSRAGFMGRATWGWR